MIFMKMLKYKKKDVIGNIDKATKNLSTSNYCKGKKKKKRNYKNIARKKNRINQPIYKYCVVGFSAMSRASESLIVGFF